MKSVYRKDRYSACPTLRYFGWWYVIVLFMDNSPSTEATGCLSSHVTRTGDFLTWHEPTQSTEGGVPRNTSIQTAATSLGPTTRSYLATN